MRPPRRQAAILIGVIVALLLLADGVEAKKNMKNTKYKVRRHKDGPIKNPSMISRCSACRAVATDLSERMVAFDVHTVIHSPCLCHTHSTLENVRRLTSGLSCDQGKQITELKLIDVIEGPGADILKHNLGHLCMAMKARLFTNPCSHLGVVTPCS
jgi:hypothetical protein